MFVWKCFKIIENALEKILLDFKTFQVFLVKCTSYVLLVVSTLSASLKTFSISLKVLSDEVDDVVEFVTCVTPTSKCKIINYFSVVRIFNYSFDKYASGRPYNNRKDNNVWEWAH